MKDIALHIMDILQNSTRAKATIIVLNIEENIENDILIITFKDNGEGMSKETLQQALNPFFTTRTTRKVGLGLSLLKHNAELTGGTLAIDSQLHKGTEVTVTFGLSHIDRPPMGDLAGTIVLTASAYPNIRFIMHYKTNTIDYIFDTQEVKESLEGVSIQEPEIVQYLIEMVREEISITN
jgi:hypothetical protein